MSPINLRQTFKGRPVFIVQDKWLDYWPTGCGVKTIRRDGATTYAAGNDPNKPVAPRVTNG